MDRPFKDEVPGNSNESAPQQAASPAVAAAPEAESPLGRDGSVKSGVGESGARSPQSVQQVRIEAGSPL